MQGDGEGDRIVVEIVRDAGGGADGGTDRTLGNDVAEGVGDAVGVVDLAVLIEVDGAAVGLALVVVGDE